MTLREYITDQGWLSLPSAELHRRMNETIVAGADDSLWNFERIAANCLTDAEMAELYDAINASTYKWALEALGGDGLPLNSTRVQNFLRALETAGKAWAIRLRKIGSGERTRYEHFVASGECTLSMVEEALS